MEPLAPLVAHEPRWARLAHQLRTKIRSGEFAAGKKLPTEEELQTEYKISRNTVRLALQQLSAEGLIEIRGRGQGTFVRPDQSTSPAPASDVPPPQEPSAAPTTLWEQLAHQLRTKIRSGEFKVGAKLPTEVKLQEQYQISRTTVRLALRKLSAEGLVEIRGRGQGTFVRDPNDPDRQLTFNAAALDVTPLDVTPHDVTPLEEHDEDELGPPDQWEDVVRNVMHRKPGTKLLSAGVEHPPEEAATLLGMSEGKTVVRRRLRSIDGKPWELVTSYFPESLVKNTKAEILLQNRLVNVPGGVLTEIGHAPRTWDDEIRSRMPTPEEATQLNIPTGVPVIEHRRTVKDSAGERVHVLISILPGDRHVLAYRGLDATRKPRGR